MGGVPCWGISDEDMLRCQQALDEAQQNRDRIADLQEALRRSPK
jgi:hypothetical protein